MGQDKNEFVQMFNNGCVYYAHKMSADGGLQQPKKIGFHTLTLYQEFSGQNVVSSFRGPVLWGDEKPYIRKLVDKETPAKEMQNMCLDMLITLLRDDSCSGWYSESVFVPGKLRKESVQKYFQRNPHFLIDPSRLNLPNFASLER
jgi:hypothetical protein